MNKVIIAVVAGTAIIVGAFLFGRVSVQPALLDRLREDDLRQFMVKVQPVIHRGYSGYFTNASIYVWADGSINVHIKTAAGTEWRAKGETLDEAKAFLIKQSAALATVLK
jgi:hypothetical protein